MSNVIQFPGSRAKLSVKDGKVISSPHFRSDDLPFEERMQRIRTSLEKINQLMQELKGIQPKDEK